MLIVSDVPALDWQGRLDLGSESSKSSSFGVSFSANVGRAVVELRN